jgi:5'-nucleotidase
VAAKAGIALAGARILVTNDDGIHAPGLRVLERVARKLSSDVWIVAPESEHSGASHALTLRRPLQVHRLGARRYATSGTPTDCVLIAVKHLLEKKPPDLILSGVNRGANLGEDVIYSGTVAAALEGAMLGIPAIAFSQVRRASHVPFKTAETFAPEIIRRLTSMAWPTGLLVNVNFPALPATQVRGVRIGPQGRRLTGTQVKFANDPFAREVLWIGDFLTDETDDPATDLGAISEKMISVTPLQFDLTNHAMLGRIAGLFRRSKPGARQSMVRK